ncbi:hypothetical protein [Tahibacter caeni]|uniref:hypothetical protein n=1 Tax=Tahibacter caeni TaxID=1453545 RepID=UPI00214809E3|nr:hypothetical protein [Tahibacter caeni]
MKPRRLPALLCLVPLLHACGGTPESFAERVQQAFESGDMDRVLAFAAIDDAPADLRFFLLDQVRECGEAATTCTAEATPLDEKFRQSLGELAAKGLETPQMPEGLIVLTAKEADGAGSGKLKMPYARVGGQYRLISQRYTAAKLAELRATTNQQLLDQMLAAGIYDMAAGERRTDWKDTATALPADGGEPGQALVRTSTALYAAAQAGDPDAAVASGNDFAKLMLSATDFGGKPVALDARKAKLRTQALRFLHDVKVGGGWQRGDEAVLLVDAKNGAGWIERGALFLSRRDDGWGVAGKQTVTYPQ